jgi:hypothetical protein
MSTAPYTGITFSYDQTIKDVGRMIVLANGFLLPESIGVLKELISNIESARTAECDKKIFLRITPAHAIKTILTTGYRDSDKGQAINVHGVLSFIWEIMNREKAKRTQNTFDIVGIATTRMDVWNENGERVARWQFEAGDANSPGCHFHASVNQQDHNEKLFPDWLKIPRLPSLLLSPMDGLEFLLGELFQSQWVQAISQDSQDRNAWVQGQSNRLSRMLAWQAKQVTDNKVGTPWMSLKRAKPPVDVLLGK